MSASKRTQYPAQTGPYKVVVKNGGGWAAFDTCRLSISVGQPYHEGEKLRATFAWAAARFDHVIVSMADTLQRYNLMAAEMSAADAHAAALAAGDEWMKRNQAALKIGDPEIQRWDQWLRHRDFAATRAAVTRLYKNHDGFRADIDAAAGAFAGRAHDPQWSTEYLLEETAVLALQQRATRAADVYPGSIMGIWDRFRRENIAGTPAGLADRHFTRIDFLRQRAA